MSWDKELLRRYRHWTWIVPLVLVVLNGSLLSMYRVVYAGRVEQLAATHEERVEALGRLQQERRVLEALLEKARANRSGIEELYRDRFATEEERLTRVISEVKDLARRSGLQPGAISYPEQSIEDYGLIQKSVVFSVEGTYVGLRRFVNFLELSESFLVLEGIKVTQSDPDLRISLTISTLFSGGETRPESGQGV